MLVKISFLLLFQDVPREDCLRCGAVLPYFTRSSSSYVSNWVLGTCKAWAIQVGSLKGSVTQMLDGPRHLQGHYHHNQQRWYHGVNEREPWQPRLWNFGCNERHLSYTRPLGQNNHSSDGERYFSRLKFWDKFWSTWFGFNGCSGKGYWSVCHSIKGWGSRFRVF